ncbi:uncharacterized protein LOC119321169 [Triticum dicoccoides]|uniref:uncharacterized protein LOC119321169 n=1 Tax=Triticum dicoccoides TaxID=85692 RepID=UPI0018912506|nr:uncharacterized protein LOC119321169 [Triticum dicoccoides]
MDAFKNMISGIAERVLQKEMARIDAETDSKLMTLGKELESSEMRSKSLRSQMDAVIAEGNRRRMHMLTGELIQALYDGLRDAFQPAGAGQPWFYGLEQKMFDLSVEKALLGIERTFEVEDPNLYNYNYHGTRYSGARAMRDNKGKGEHNYKLFVNLLLQVASN